MSTERKDMQASFLSDVKDHAMQIIRDDGVYRHVRFKRPGTICMSFDLITWPGKLCYTGDMGTFVFQRLTDMFEFFRTDRDRAKEGEIRINPSYWSEKLIAVDGGRRNGGAMEFSEERFKQVITEYVNDWLDGHDASEDDAESLRESVRDEVLDRIDAHDESYSYRLADEFEHDVDGSTFQFQDLFEHSFTDYTHHFMWCCYAVAWGVEQYDKAQAEVQP